MSSDCRDISNCSTNRCEELIGTQVIKQMRGGSQSLLMLDQHLVPWVVKFRANPQHSNVVINEFLATRIGASLGLSIPATQPIRVDERLSHSITQWIPPSSALYEPGLHIASRFVGGLLPGLVLDILPKNHLRCVTNLNEYAGISILDLWLCNTDARQVVYSRPARVKKYKMFWIDFGHCFGGGMWKLCSESAIRYSCGEMPRPLNWNDYEPWIILVEQFPIDALERIFEDLPASWRFSRQVELDELANRLHARRFSLREVVERHLRDTSLEQPSLIPRKRGLCLDLEPTAVH